jgi:GWxTD domain-containing protein
MKLLPEYPMIETIAVRGPSRFVFPAFVLAALLLPRDAPGQSSLNELFQRGKTESKLGSYQASLATFQQLDLLSRRPGNEAARAKLEPLIAFYLGVNHAALGQKETARVEFQTYLASFPGAHLDPAVFPRSVRDVFDAAKEQFRSAEGTDRRRPSDDSPIAADYARFRPGSDTPPADNDKWAEGALRFLMTRPEQITWERATDPAQRAEFITAFWRRRDPNPDTPENEFRDEIERRIRYSDARFAAEEKRGSATDRGLVFVLLGPPSYVGQKPFKSEDDPVQVARAAPEQDIRFNPDGTKTITMVPRTGLTAETLQGTREIWYYRRDRLPKVVKFTEVDFEFITRKGFGTAVLQRDHEVLVTLDLVAHSTLPSRD